MNVQGEVQVLRVVPARSACDDPDEERTYRHQDLHGARPPDHFLRLVHTLVCLLR